MKSILISILAIFLTIMIGTAFAFSAAPNETQQRISLCKSARCETNNNTSEKITPLHTQHQLYPQKKKEK